MDQKLQDKGWQYIKSASKPEIFTDADTLSQTSLPIEEDTVSQRSLVTDVYIPKPIKPVEFYPEKDLAIEIDVDTKKFTELKFLKGAMWKYIGDKDVTIVK